MNVPVGHQALLAYGPKGALSIILALAGASAWAGIATTPVYAACHSFTVSVNPASVNEGSRTVATVSRDGALNPSSIQVDSVDQTAIAGRDYNPVHQRLSFTTETSQTLQVNTIHNPAHEGAQTFLIQLSGGMGCAINPHFIYGPPARVTVVDTDAVPIVNPTPVKTPPSAPAQPPSAAPILKPTPVMTPRSAPAQPPRADPAGTAPGSASSSPSSDSSASSPPPVALAPSPSPSQAFVRSSGASLGSSPPGGGPSRALIAAGVLVMMVGGGVYFLRRRTSR